MIGELVPKSVAIRRTEKAALFTAVPLVIFRYIFIAPIWLLNGTVNAILRLFRLPPVKGHGVHSEEEIRIILDQSQSSGMLSFRRLLHIENVLDMGTLNVRNAMRARRLVRCLFLGKPRSENEKLIAENRFSRYPCIGDDPERPLGYVHIKDLYLAERAGKPTDDLRPYVRPCLQFKEQDPLEQRLSEMQRKAAHMALVFAEDGRWTGIITLEDAIEEVIGTVEEEYPIEPPVRLSDLLTAEHTLLDVEGDSILSATRHALQRISVADLPGFTGRHHQLDYRARAPRQQLRGTAARHSARASHPADRPDGDRGAAEGPHPLAGARVRTSTCSSSFSRPPTRLGSTRSCCPTSRGFSRAIFWKAGWKTPPRRLICTTSS